MIEIGSLTITNKEIIKTDSNIGFSRSISTNSRDEYTLGKNRNLFQINIRNKTPLYKITLNLLLSKNKFIQVEELYNQQLSEKLFNYNISDDVKTSVLYSYNNPSSKKIYCFIEKFELLDSLIKGDNIVYRCVMDIIEI